MILSNKAIRYKNKLKILEQSNEILHNIARSLCFMLESQQNVKNQNLILESKKSTEKLKDVVSTNASEFPAVQIALLECPPGSRRKFWA